MIETHADGTVYRRVIVVLFPAEAGDRGGASMRRQRVVERSAGTEAA